MKSCETTRVIWNRSRASNPLSKDLNKNIAITGFMAVGKSVVGRMLAQRLKRPFVDLDHAIEGREGSKVADIFKLKGEAYFRKLEKETLEEVLNQDGQVIATGGGAVTDKENLQLLKTKSVLVCLTASLEKLRQRSGRANHRPLLEGTHRLQRIKELLQHREEAYRQSHVSIDTDHLPVAKVVDEIIKAVKLSVTSTED